MNAPMPDQLARDRFRDETERNFSVIAPAGVGKTTAIVSRIVRIGLEDAMREQPLLPRLVVVTYTKKAAEELQDRARRQLLEEARGNEHILRLFGQAFFGTIHSFCLELLRRYGHHLGLPATLDVPEDEAALWRRFIRRQDRLTDLMPSVIRDDFLRLVPLGKVLALARRLSATQTFPAPGPLPAVNLEPLLAFAPKKASAATVERSQRAAEAWLQALDNPASRSLGMPIAASKASGFKDIWTAAFQPVEDWLAAASLYFASQVARRYRDYRLEAGQLTYDDQIELTDALLDTRVAREEIRARGLCVILDEAQDTDPAQFRVLTSIARNEQGRLPGGRFCMVGDPQQSIYSDRADLATYLDLHEEIAHSVEGESLTFSVTMRCDRAVVAAVNAIFPQALDGEGGQVELVPLEAKPGAGTGNVERQLLRIEPEGTRKEEIQRAEAEALANWLSAQEPGDFGVRRWGEVALLCPRKDGLEALAFALGRSRLKVQNHSRKDIRGDDPAHAWLSALLWVLAYPGDSFELFGVLREVYACRDGEMAALVQASAAGHPLTLEEKPSAAGPVGDALAELYALRQTCTRLPLREAVEEVINRTQLRERLRALPEAVCGRAPETLAALRLEASQAEAAGRTLAGFARSLRLAYNQQPGEAAPEPDSVQLLTCHKAKGLEWPVVIVPFLFSAVRPAHNEYPQLLGAANETPTLAMSSNHDCAAAKAAAAQRERQMLQRLLYVTATRARNCLILIDDEAAFPKPGGSFASLLAMLDAEDNRSHWEALPVFAPKSGLYPARHAPNVETTETPAYLPPFSEIDETAVERTAADFPERLLPSGLARHEGDGHHRDERDLAAEPLFPEIRAAAAAKRGADYGNWWHQAMETLPWSDPASWQSHLEARLALCPDPPRGESELSLFGQSPAAAMLSEPGLIIRTELPVFWPEDARHVYDGSIDLAARLPDGTWLVLDWKTDIIGEAGLPGLLHTYGPQLDCYRRALTAFFKSETTACLYSTRTGELVYLDA